MRWMPVPLMMWPLLMRENVPMQNWFKPIVFGLAGVVLGILSVLWWHAVNYPMQPLFVEISNQRGVTIPLLTIEHGSDLSQEKILLTQIRTGETRIVSLNHEPGRGYSIEAQFADGSSVEACVGKLSQKWVNQVLITSNGIFGGD
jgi:hypothetical protein